MDIIQAPKKYNLIWDATTLSSFMSCERYHDIRFNHRFVPIRGKSNSLEVGSLIHKVLETYYKHLINGFPRNTAIGNALASGQLYVIGCPHCSDVLNESPACKHEQGEYPGVNNTPENNDRFITGWKFALDTCEQYFEHYKNDSFIPLASEQVKKEILYEDDEIRILWKAKFDLIIDTNEVGIISMDHKTFKQKRDKSTLSNQFIGQCLLLKARIVQVNKIGLQSSLPIKDRLVREIVSFTEDRLMEWQTEILPYYAYQYIQAVEREYYKPDYTHCDNMYGSCPYKPVCEANRNMREEILRSEFMIAPVWDPTSSKEDA